MKGYKFIYKDGTTIFIQHDDLYEGEWTHIENIVEVYKDFNFYEK